jgi:intracellular multiplication protein IcmL
MTATDQQDPQQAPDVITPEEDLYAYRDGFKYLLWFVKLESLAIVLATGIVLYVFMNYQPQDTYFAIGVQGNQERLLDVKEPNVNRAALLAWVAAAATQSTTFGFTDYQDTFAKAQKNFSPNGWKSYQEALTRSGLLQNVVKYQQILSSIPISPPMVQAEGLLEGEYRWIVSVVLVQTTRAGNKRATRYVPITMILVKMPTRDNPMGVGINTWVESG